MYSHAAPFLRLGDKPSLLYRDDILQIKLLIYLAIMGQNILITGAAGCMHGKQIIQNMSLANKFVC
jgi:FlaA1/EpsC-like NDP-sugar epimerase